MVKVMFSTTRSDGPLYYNCSGHADYKDPVTGNNDICVAISTLNLQLARHMDVEYGISPKKFEDGEVIFDISGSNMWINEVFKSVFNTIKYLSELYPNQIKVY